MPGAGHRDRRRWIAHRSSLQTRRAGGSYGPARRLRPAWTRQLRRSRRAPQSRRRSSWAWLRCPAASASAGDEHRETVLRLGRPTAPELAAGTVSPLVSRMVTVPPDASRSTDPARSASRLGRMTAATQITEPDGARRRRPDLRIGTAAAACAAGGRHSGRSPRSCVDTRPRTWSRHRAGPTLTPPPDGACHRCPRRAVARPPQQPHATRPP